MTDRVQMISQQYDYSSVLSQCVFQMLHYGQCFQFPKECWHSEKQIERDKDGEEKEVYTKEGIRYHMPHPSRTFWDVAHRPSTFNSDSGSRYSGYWTIQRYGEIESNSMYYNTDKISTGSIDWLTSNPNFGVYINAVIPGLLNGSRRNLVRCCWTGKRRCNITPANMMTTPFLLLNILRS